MWRRDFSPGERSLVGISPATLTGAERQTTYGPVIASDSARPVAADIAPTLAKMCGIAMPAATGRVLAEAVGLP